MARSRTNRAPALAVSALLHAAAIAAALITWQTTKHLTIGSVVPVEIVNGPPADMAPAIQAPEPAEATSETPQSEALTPPTPEATPAPTPPKPATPPPPTPKQMTPPTPKPTPAPGKPTATAVAKPEPKGQGKPAKGFSMDQLYKSLTDSKPARPAHKFSLADLEASLKRSGRGAPGQNRARAAAVATTGAGTTDRVSASDVNGLAAKLQQLWNPNCDVEGAAGINVKVLIHFGPGGSLSGAPELVDRSIDPLGSSLLSAAAHRALSAVVRGAPFTDMPADFAGNVIVNFNAREACARR